MNSTRSPRTATRASSRRSRTHRSIRSPLVNVCCGAEAMVDSADFWFARDSGSATGAGLDKSADHSLRASSRASSLKTILKSTRRAGRNSCRTCADSALVVVRRLPRQSGANCWRGLKMESGCSMVPSARSSRHEHQRRPKCGPYRAAGTHTFHATPLGSPHTRTQASPCILCGVESGLLT